MQKRLAGGIFIFIGIALILNSFSGITGFVVVEDIKPNTGGIFGIVLLVGGLALFILQAQEGREVVKGDLEEISEGGVRIIRSKPFQKSLRKHRPQVKIIRNALNKIGTELGGEEFLRHMKTRSIRTSQGGRILFNYRNGHAEAVLENYLPPSKHY